MPYDIRQYSCFHPHFLPQLSAILVSKDFAMIRLENQWNIYVDLILIVIR